MRREIGTVVALAGLAIVLVSGIVGPWISKTFYTIRMADGQLAYMSPFDSQRGTHLCIAFGLAIILFGIAMQIALVLMGRRALRQKDAAGEGPDT